MKMNDRGSSFLFSNEDRSGVARPSAICWVDDELQLSQIDPRAREIGPRQLLIPLIVHQDSHQLAGCNFSNHFSVHPANRIQLAWPIGRIVGPPQPGRFVLFPFRGHDKSEFRRTPLHCAFLFLCRHKRNAENRYSRTKVQRASGWLNRRDIQSR